MKSKLRGFDYSRIVLYIPAILSVFTGLFAYEKTFGGAVCRTLAFAFFIAFLALFGIDAGKRIADKFTRAGIIHIVLLFVFWILVRTIKFEIAESAFLVRQLWYSYYIPIIFSALFFFLVVDNLCLEKEELKTWHLYITGGISVFLVLTVITNDIHGFVFDGATEGHNAGYYFVALFVVVLMLSSLIRLFVYNGGFVAIKKMMPAVFSLICVFIYSILYALPSIGSYMRFVDFTVVYIVGTVSFLEGLINCGAIPSNNDYKWCFMHSTVNAQIVDDAGKVRYRSLDARPVLLTEIEALAEKGTLRVSSDKELVSAPISGGKVIWERNIRDINRLMDILFETQDSIKEATDSLKESIEIEKRQRRAIEQNRLYDITFSKVADSVSILENCIGRAENLSGELLKCELRKIDILGVYVKRKSNLLLLSETGLEDFSGELKLCFKETFDNLKDSGILGNFRFSNDSEVSFKEAIVLYELLEKTLEASIYTLLECNAIVSKRDRLILTVNLVMEDVPPYEVFCKGLELPKDVTFNYERDESEITVSFRLPKKEEER